MGVDLTTLTDLVAVTANVGIQPIIGLLVTMLQLFFPTNKIAQEIEVVLPEVGNAIVAAQNHQAFSVSVPLAHGTYAVSYTPNP